MSVTDQELVERSRNGDRDAFAEMVGRYQSLACSVAYGATGNFALSEEIAQDAFVEAWKSLGKLNDPAKLRAWLCGITRNLARSSARRGKRDVLKGALQIDTQVSAADTVTPDESTMRDEEIALVDQTLESMPASYREPLVLFYRENQSVAKVAELLDLSQDAVKQRLSRGRRMLRDEVTDLIERGLRVSAPGRAFTIGVLAALPLLSGTAKAATALSATATAKGVGAMGSATAITTIGTIFGPLIGVLGGWFGYQMSLKHARSDQERHYIKKMSGCTLVAIAMFGAAMMMILFNAKALGPIGLTIAIVFAGLFYSVGLFTAIWHGNKRIIEIRQETGTLENAVTTASPFIRGQQTKFAYESGARFLGLPLLSVHFSGGVGFGDPRMKKAKTAVGWIAIGDKAVGVVAMGGVAFGLLSIGAIAMGGIGFGGVALAVLAMGGVGIGGFAYGGAAAGYLAFGGAAIGIRAALGGIATAQDFAIGGIAHAAEANTEVAKAFIESHWFFKFGQYAQSPWFLWPVLAFFIAPLVLLTRWIGKRAAELNNEVTDP